MSFIAAMRNETFAQHDACEPAACSMCYLYADCLLSACRSCCVEHLRTMWLMQVRMWDIRTSGCIHVFDQHDTHAGSSSRQSRQANLPPAALHKSPFI